MSHEGTDFFVGAGVPVMASDDGIVALTASGPVRGNFIVLVHRRMNGRAIATVYAHLATVAVQTGSIVSSGQQIGTVGATGDATGPNLHFEVRVDGQPFPSRFPFTLGN